MFSLSCAISENKEEDKENSDDWKGKGDRTPCIKQCEQKKKHFHRTLLRLLDNNWYTESNNFPHL